MKRCSHFSIHQWGEPPLEPGESGTLYEEEHCGKKRGYNVVNCGGDEEFCELSQQEKPIYKCKGSCKESVKILEEFAKPVCERCGKCCDHL